MNADLTEKLQSILSDKEAVEKLRQIAGNLNLSSQQNETERQMPGSEDSGELMYSNKQEDAENSENKTYIKGKTHTSDDHINLILALRPFLSDDRKETADRIVQLLKLLKVADLGKLLRG